MERRKEMMASMESPWICSLSSSNSTRNEAYVEISNKTQIRNHKKKWDQRGLLSFVIPYQASS